MRNLDDGAPSDGRGRHPPLLSAAIVLAVAGIALLSGMGRGAAADRPPAVPTPGPGAQTIYSVTNPYTFTLTVQHVFTTTLGFRYSFWDDVPPLATSTYHVSAMPQIPSPFRGAVTLYASLPFLTQIVGYDYPSTTPTVCPSSCTPTRTATPALTPTLTPSRSPTKTSTPTWTPTRTVTVTPMRSATPSPTPTPSLTATRTATTTPTRTTTATLTATRTPTATATRTTVPSSTPTGGPRFVQSALGYVGSLVSSQSATFASPVASGDLIVVLASTFNFDNSSVVSSVTDNVGNVYVKAVEDPSPPTGAEEPLSVWYAANARGGSNLTVTLAVTNPGSISLAIHEYAGVTASSGVDRVQHASGTGSVASSGMTASTTQANELLVGATTFLDIATVNASAGTGYTLRQSQPSNQCCNALFTEDALAGPPGPYAATFTFAQPVSYRAVVVAFRP